MSEHYHYFFAYRYDEEDRQGYGHVCYRFRCKLNEESINELVEDIIKKYSYTSVVIMFFHELECDCEEKINDK